MIKVVFLLMGILMVLSAVVSMPAQACLLCGNCTALNLCYDRCKTLFNDETLRTSCYGGCLIGCWISADA